MCNHWLTDSVMITASFRLLKNDHPAVGGLKPTVLAKSKSGFDIQEKDFVQVFDYRCSVCIFTLVCFHTDSPYKWQSLGYYHQYWM